MDLAQQPEWKQLLVNVVKKEGLDPWDIDINLLTDKFMSELSELKTFDFRIPANAILASSILLRFKSDKWRVNPLVNDVFEPMFIPDKIIQPPVFPDLHPVFRETRRMVTLNELIDAIEDVMIKEKVKAGKSKKLKEDVPDVLIDLVKSNEVDFEKSINDVYDKIKSKMDTENLITLSQLISEKDINEFLNVFVPVLHLANKGMLNVWQEEVFGEIFIHLNDGLKTKSLNGKSLKNNGFKKFSLNKGVSNGSAKGS